MDTTAAEAMNRIYRHQRHIYDFTRKFFLLGRDHLVRSLHPPPSGHVLEIGCGTGRNLIMAARRYRDAHFYGVDISSAMLATARSRVAHARLDRRIILAQGDACDFNVSDLFGRASFDRIFFSFSLSMIPPWEMAIGHALDCLAADGRLHVVDFGGQEHLPRWFGRALDSWLTRFDVVPRRDLDARLLHAAQSRNAGCESRNLYAGFSRYGEIALISESAAAIRHTYAQLGEPPNETIDRFAC